MHIEDLARIIYAFFVKKGDARRNLTSYLELHLRPDIFNKVNIDGILRSVSNKVGEDIDKKLFLEDLVDKFIEEKKGDDIEPLIVSKAKRKFEISSDKAHDIIGSRKWLNKEDRVLLKDMVKEYTPLISKYLLTYFDNKYKEWIREHEEEPRITEDMPEPSVEPIHEEVEKERKKWDLQLVHQFLDQNAPEKHKDLYHLLLDKVLANGMKPIEFAKKYNIKPNYVNKRIIDLKLMLAKWFSDIGIAPKFIDEGLAKGEEIPKPPDYKTHLKDPENLKSFKDFLKYETLTENQEKIINLLLERKSPKEIAKELDYEGDIKSWGSFWGIKKKFNTLYNKWYEEKIKELKKAYFVRKAFMKLRRANKIILPYEKIAKRVTIPYKRKEEEEEKEEAIGAAHEKMVQDAIEKHKIVATIYFSANYDNLDVIAGRKDPKKDPVDFKYQKYEASLFLERKYGKNVRSIDYRYTQDLKSDGTFTGSDQSSLALDGSKVSPNNDLKKELDNYVEHHMKPEGMLPYGRALSGKTKNVLFPVGYENTKTNKDYSGVRNFFEKYRGLLVEDIVHEKRQKEVERRERGRTLPPSDKKKVKEMIFDFKEEIEDEKAKKTRDTKRIKELEQQIKKLEDLLKGHEIGEDIDKIIEEEMKYLKPEHEPEKTAMILPYEKIAEAFPSPESENVKKLIGIFDEYGVKKPLPTGWLEPVDILTLAKSLKAHTRVFLENKLKDLKKQKGLKKTERDSRAHELESKVREDMGKAVDYFKDIPVDLKKRLDKLNETDFANLKKRRNIDWVDDKNEIDRIMRKIKMEFAKDKAPKPRKKEVVRLLEKGKYRSLEAFLETELNGIKVLAQRLDRASLIEEEMDPDLRSQLETALSESEENFKDAREELEEISESGEGDKERVEELRKSFPQYISTIKEMKSALRTKDAPALAVAKVLNDKLEYFSSLYSLLSSILWFGQYALITKAKDEDEDKGPTEEDIKDLKTQKKKIVDLAILVSKYNILAKDQIKSGIAKLRTLLKSFIGEYRYFNASMPYTIAADENDWEKARIKAIFPEDEMAAAKKMVNDLKTDKRMAPMTDNAQRELNEIIRNVSNVYREGFSTKKIQALADKEGIPFNKASVRLKRIQDSIARNALSEFILKWKKIKERGYAKKERSPLGNRPHTEYDEMGDFIERHLPDLFKLIPPEEVPEEPARGIATPKAIREYIEEAFSRKAPKEMEEKFDIYEDIPERREKGKGPKTKARKKQVKTPPPRATIENIKDRFTQMFDKPAEHIVLSTMAFYVKRIKDVIKTLKPDEYIDAGDVIDALVTLLKQLQFMITTLRVEPSATAFKKPPPGAPQFSGRPDIVIDSSDDAKRVFKKIVDIYKVINKYIAPDEVGIPPADLSQIRKPKKYLPTGLVDWYQHLEETEKARKVALMLPMAYRIVGRFAGTGIQKMDKYSEEDIIAVY